MEQNYPGSREIIRQAFLIRGTPAAAMNATLASITQATTSQYSKPIKLWWSFCKLNQINCFRPSVSSFLEFLALAFTEVGSYSTLNTYRSAISLITSVELGSHPLIKRFFKGVAALKPQRPRYEFVWDPSLVIAHLASYYPHDNLSLEIISRKLVTLLALTTAQRMQTLAAIRISNIRVAESVIIRIPARLKTSGIGKSQPLLIFKPFADKPELCIFTLIKFYLNFTQELRAENCDSFFIAVRPPYKAVTSQSLGRWIKIELKEAGINTSIFSSHSTRHASTSLAASRGVSVDEIRRTAGWSKSSEVFARFYNRPIVSESSFHSMILSDI